MARLLRLDNRTRWRDADLKKFFLAGLKKLGCGPRTIRVRYGRGRAHTGFAYYNSQLLQICLPGPGYMKRARKKPLDYKELAQTFEHEIDHTLGLSHSEMPDWWTLRPAWHKGLEIRWEPEEKLGLRMAKTKLQAAEKRLESARKARNKWRRKVRQLKGGR